MSGGRFLRACGGALAAGALIAAGAQGAWGGTTSKPYSLVITPGSVASGSPVTFTVTLTNESNPQTLGSSNINLPSGTGFVLTGASITTSPVAGATATLAGQVVELRSLDLPPGDTVVASVTGFAPCPSESPTWQVVTKQSNDFSGPPGNDFFLDQHQSRLALATTGSCSLSFVTGEPNNALENTPITTNSYAAGNPVAVTILDANGDQITSASAPASTASIAVAIAANPGGGTLSGTTPVTASGGAADFGDLSISLPGIGYTLTASTTLGNVTPATSTGFDIANCAPGQQCTVTTADNKQTSKVNGTSTTAAVVIESLGKPSFSCSDTNKHASEETTLTAVNYTSAGPKTATVTILNPVAPASKYQVCYTQPDSFTTRSGAVATTGLLQDCSKTVPANLPPCVQSISKVGSTVVEVILIPGTGPDDPGWF